MKIIIQNKLILVMVIFLVSLGLLPATTMASTQKSQTLLTNIQNRTSNEIAQRLSSLRNLNSQVNGSTKMSSGDKSLLSTEIENEIDGLSALNMQISSDTTVAQASSDEATIFSSYRVYAVMTPKFQLLTISDNQLNNEAKLTNLSQTLESKIATAETAGKNVSSVSNQLSAMNSLISQATTISSTIQSSVSAALPSSWNTNHNLFGGDRAQLNQAYQDNVNSNKYNSMITSALKKLK